ncbi:unnamed protein product [Laminaria digitata]
MDSSLEEEIARLSRPPTAENAEPIPALPSSATTNVTVMPRPINNAAALQQQAREDVAAPAAGANRLRRGSSGSSSGDLSRSGSGRQRSPQRAAAVLAGRTISELQLPQQLSWQHHQQRRLGGGSGGITAPNGRSSRPARLTANGEKVAGPRPSVTGEKMAGPRPSPLGEKVSGFSGAVTPAGSTSSSSAVRKGPSKEEEAWKRSEEALKKKEQSVRNALKEKQRTLQQESLLLATVDRELAQLALDHQTEVNDLRKTLEVVDRELAFLDRDAQRKLEAFEKARTVR